MSDYTGDFGLGSIVHSVAHAAKTAVHKVVSAVVHVVTAAVKAVVKTVKAVAYATTKAVARVVAAVVTTTQTRSSGPAAKGGGKPAPPQTKHTDVVRGAMASTATVKGKQLTKIGPSLKYYPSPKFDFSNGLSSAYDGWQIGELAGGSIGCAAGNFLFPAVGCLLLGGIGAQILGATGAIYGWSQGISDNPLETPSRLVNQTA